MVCRYVVASFSVIPCVYYRGEDFSLHSVTAPRPECENCRGMVSTTQQLLCGSTFSQSVSSNICNKLSGVTEMGVSQCSN